MMDLTDALSDLKAELQAGTAPQKALEYTASEHGCKVEVLRIRFERGHGVTVEAFSEAQLAIVHRDPVTEALEEARKYASRCSLPAWQHASIGKPFWWKGEKYLFAAYVSGSFGLRGVKVETGHLMQFKGGTANQIVDKLSKGA